MRKFPLLPIIKEADELNKDKIIRNLVSSALAQYYKNKQEGNNEKIKLRRLYRKEVKDILKYQGIFDV